MTIVLCKICNSEFYAKPVLIKKGWGVYCSRKCKGVGTRVRTKVLCHTCKKETLKTNSKIKHSKSKKYFCNKSCQTKWRNVEFSGRKHKNYIDGRSMYVTIIEKSKLKKKCELCDLGDKRVLVVHHIDENHKNNEIKNLAWLCHNCHSLVHYDKLEKQRFLDLRERTL